MWLVQSNKDKPPAYDHISLPPSSERPLNGYRNVGAPSPKSPGPSSDQVHILDKKNEIQGKFYHISSQLYPRIFKIRDILYRPGYPLTRSQSESQERL